MKAVSINGFSFAATPSSEGDRITLVADKNDHEGKQTVVFNLTAEAANLLSSLIDVALQSAKERRKAIRRARVEKAFHGPESLG